MQVPGEQQLDPVSSIKVIAGPCPRRDVPIPAVGLLIGRGAGADLSLAEDEAVSHRHARLARHSGGTLFIVDEGSTNGTYLNGMAVLDPSAVREADVIKVGSTELLACNTPSLVGPVAQAETHLLGSTNPVNVTDPHPRQFPASGTRDAGASASSPDDQVLMSARAAYGRGDFEASSAAFGRLIASPGHAAEASYGLGMIATAQGRAQDGEKFFRASLSADPTFANAWYQLGQLSESQSPAEAARFFREALRHNPRHAGALQKLRAAPVAGADRAPEAPRQLIDRMPVVEQVDSVPQPPPPPHRAPQLQPRIRPAASPRPSPTDSSTPVGRATTSRLIRGRVVGFERRAEQSFFLHRLYLYVWDFRVERPGLPPVMVEMRGYRFTGDISDGDQVEIAARNLRSGHVLRVRQLVNLTTNAEIRTSYGRGRRTLAAASKILAALLILAAVIGVGIIIVRHTQH